MRPAKLIYAFQIDMAAAYESAPHCSIASFNWGHTSNGGYSTEVLPCDWASHR
jgi:hypothetical protein